MATPLQVVLTIMCSALSAGKWLTVHMTFNGAETQSHSEPRLKVKLSGLFMRITLLHAYSVI